MSVAAISEERVELRMSCKAEMVSAYTVSLSLLLPALQEVIFPAWLGERYESF